MDPFAQLAYVGVDLATAAADLDSFLLHLPADSPVGLLVAEAFEHVVYARTLLDTGDDRITRLLARTSVRAAVDALRTAEAFADDVPVRRSRSALELSHAGLY